MPYNPTKYKKPGRINSVSISLVFLLGIFGYLGYSFYPNFITGANVKDLMRRELLNVYRMNLRGMMKTEKMAAFRKKMEEGIRAQGVPAFELEIGANEDIVWMETRFTSEVKFEGLDKTYVWHHSPRVETSAERVEWD